jgi:hypothetical protein
MAGAERTLARHRPYVISEFCPDAIRSISGMSWDAYLGSFTDRRYGIQVISHDGLFDCGTDHGKVMAAFEHSGVDHIDLLFQPDASPLEA